jgi:hypothetical protein
MLRPSICAVLCTTWLAASTLPASAETWSFEGDEIGMLPAGWEAAQTGEGPGSVWQVVADDSAPDGSRALAQMSSDGQRRMFSPCVVKDSSHLNPDLSVSFKAVSGVVDQGGGLVWRYRDANNYYIARLNPLETNYRIYKVVDGQRSQVRSVQVDTPPGEWHRLRVVQQGNRIRGYLDGKQLLDVTDDTFRDAGRIGLWTKADAVTFFDDLHAEEGQ